SHVAQHPGQDRRRVGPENSEDFAPGRRRPDATPLTPAQMPGIKAEYRLRTTPSRAPAGGRLRARKPCVFRGVGCRVLVTRGYFFGGLPLAEFPAQKETAEWQK